MPAAGSRSDHLGCRLVYTTVEAKRLRQDALPRPGQPDLLLARWSMHESALSPQHVGKWLAAVSNAARYFRCSGTVYAGHRPQFLDLLNRRSPGRLGPVAVDPSLTPAVRPGQPSQEQLSGPRHEVSSHSRRVARSYGSHGHESYAWIYPPAVVSCCYNGAGRSPGLARSRTQ